jgi:IS30 family transposase
MSYNHLTMDERNVIYTMQWQGYSDAEIARCLGRHRSTIGRECKRNPSCLGPYNPVASGRTIPAPPRPWPTVEDEPICAGPRPAIAA